jgi:AAHS family 4-hydroxybenzoate transporter-like MFS transporter
MDMQTRVNVRACIDERPFGRYQLLVTGLCALIVFLDGFDTQAIGYVAPAIIKEFGVSRAALSPVFSASLIGLMLGALIGGPVSDRFGRRPVLLGGMVFFGIMSLLTVMAGSIESLLVLRLLTGLGLGCVMPNAIALTSEYAPARVRSTAVMVMFCGFSLGAALGGLAAAVLIKDFGWQSVFVAGGVLPLVAAGAVWLWLPESVRFLVLNGGDKQRIAAIMQKIDPAFAGKGVLFQADEHKETKFPVKQLFADKRALLTGLLWVVFFMSLMDLYFLSNWLPTVINDAGIPVGSAALITAMLQVGGTVGTLVLGRVFDKVSPFLALSVIYFAGGDDLRRRLLRHRRPDRRQRAGGQVLPDLDPRHRGGMVAGHRPHRFGARSGHRRHAAVDALGHAPAVPRGRHSGVHRRDCGAGHQPVRRRAPGRGITAGVMSGHQAAQFTLSGFFLSAPVTRRVGTYSQPLTIMSLAM